MSQWIHPSSLGSATLGFEAAISSNRQLPVQLTFTEGA